eukprot:TRINITY_DN3817_c0_g2_i2.p1 TRINITY_DN3817_c0_g2~~TRINITY_DN3817_c0_g2_i2.p1  ORF type:complete len:366 (+),score=59.01 TRINITY_DN3817_c0_g2_i2:78-1175(+)
MPKKEASKNNLKAPALTRDDSIQLQVPARKIKPPSTPRKSSISSESKEIEVPRLEHEPVRIQLAVRVLNVFEISNVDQCFKVDFIVIASWKDPQLVGVDPALVDWDNVWNPRLNVKNALDLESLDDTLVEPWALENPATGNVVKTMRYRGTVHELLELDEFPFDFQALTIIISTGLTSQQVQFQCPSHDKIRMNAATLPEWRFVAPSFEVVTTDPLHSTKRATYSEFHFRLRAIRNSGYYVWNVAAVVFLIVTLSLISFTIPPSEISDRLSITLTLMLTAVAFKLVVAESLPKMSGLTLLDKYVFAAFMFVYLVAIQNGLVGLASEENQHFVDRACFWFLVTSWSLFHGVTLVCIYKLRKKMNWL